MANVVNADFMPTDEVKPKKREAESGKKAGSSVNVVFTNLHHQPLQLFNYSIPVGEKLTLVRPIGLAMAQTPDAKNLAGLKWLKIEM